MQPELLWEAISKKIISKAGNEKKPEIKCSNELKSKAYTEEPVKQMIGCPASALIFHFSKLSTHSLRALKIHPDPGFLDLPKFRHSFLKEVTRTLNVIISSLFLNVKTIVVV